MEKDLIRLHRSMLNTVANTLHMVCRTALPKTDTFSCIRENNRVLLTINNETTYLQVNVSGETYVTTNHDCKTMFLFKMTDSPDFCYSKIVELINVIKTNQVV